MVMTATDEDGSRATATPPRESGNAAQPSEYDRLARLAGRLLEARFACVALVERGTVAYLAVHGMDTVPPARFEGLCRRAVETGRTVSPDTPSGLPRGSAGSLCVAAPFFMKNGVAAGALCVADDANAPLDARGRAVLEDLASFVSDAFDRHRKMALADMATEVLKSSERHFRELLDAAPVLVWMCDQDQRCTFCNRNWLAFTGHTMDTVLGDGCWGGIHPDDADRVSAVFEEAYRAHSAYSHEYRQRNGEGQYRWLLETGQPVADNAGAFRGIVGSAIDITDLKVAEARLETRTRELELSNSALEQFAAIAAHDLRTPLRHVLQFAELLREEHRERLGTDASDYADNIVLAVHRMKNIVSNLLELARIPVSSGSDTFAVFALADAVSHAHANVGTAAIEVTCDALPPAWGAQGLIAQLLQNLFDNSVKYHGEGRPCAHVSARREKDMLLVCVADDGPGIAAEHREHAFKMFARPGARDMVAGNGIGLTLCKRIAAFHGGDMWVDADYSPGLRICFSVPVHPDARLPFSANAI